MNILNNLLGGGLKDVLSGAEGIIDKFKLSPTEKNQFKLEMEALLQRQEANLEETYRQEVNAKMEILKTELTQGDNYTKRARPSVIYAGLIFIFFIYVVVPTIAFFTGKQSPSLTLPEDFWWAWGSIVSVYGIGRSVEKSGSRNQITNVLTGSGAYKVDKEAKG